MNKRVALCTEVGKLSLWPRNCFGKKNIILLSDSISSLSFK